MTKGKGWWSQVTLLRLSQALQDRRCSFAGGGGWQGGLGGRMGHWGAAGPQGPKDRGGRQESTETLRTA